ncbi:MAG: carbohydrate porin [Myxococcota bacterium]|nr:carbohydrate porin [Myxococcota bacterium]
MSLSMLLMPLALAQDPPQVQEEGFVLGSYGRAQAAGDLQGGAGQPVQITAFGPRLEADPYAEIDLGWFRSFDDGASFRVLITPALSGAPFHYDGQWDADLALRNLYGMATLQAPADTEVSFWAGSRMYRGDDLYLLNFWPLDMLNTIGGGAEVNRGPLQVRLHGGVNRLVGEDYQVQSWSLPTPGGVESQDVLVLDRQRRILSARVGYQLPISERLTLQGRLYGEHHHLPEGTRIVDNEFTEDLPADGGVVVGAQLSAWGWAPDSFVHLWLRHATGLAAYGELSIPTEGLAPDYSVSAAQSSLIAAGANHRIDRVSVALGGYARAFQDADGQVQDVDDGWEMALVARPTIHVSEHVGLGLEASHQVLRPNGVNPRTDTVDVPQVTKLSVFPQITPTPGTFSRPMIYGIYSYSRLNSDAQDWYDPMDSRAQGMHRHYVGVGVEWWMNSQSYGRQ